jgi:hypothetical protein
VHVNWGFWGALLGVSTLASCIENKYEQGDQLAKTLILLAGNGEDDEFYRVLGQYRFPGSMRQAYAAACAAAEQVQQLHDGQISSAPHMQRFRDWCRSLV